MTAFYVTAFSKTSISDNGTLLSSYEYDGLNRLIRENNVNDNTITLYYYNNGGNITEKRIYSYSTYSNTATNSFLNITPKKTIAYGYAESGQKDRLLSYNGTEDLAYDSHGNPKQWFKHDGNYSYLRLGLSWSKVNRLTEITDTDSNEKYEYTYDYNGIRTSKKVGNTLHKYYLDGSNIIAETRTTDGVVSKLKYYYGTMGLVGFNYNGTDYYYQKNIQGDIVRIYNNSGTLYGEYRYDAWGNCTIITDTSGIATINPFRYRGYYLDNETGLCYLNSRYYDPTVGRFLSPDSLEYLEPEDLGGLNLYSYCNNNPVNYYDPSGKIAIFTVIGIVLSVLATVAIGVAIGGFVGGIEALAKGESFISGFVGGAVSGFITTIGLGIGLALGGIGGLVVAGIFGFFGGFVGSVVQQGVNSNWESIDYFSAFISGITTMMTNILSYKFAEFINKAMGHVFGESAKFITKFIDAMTVSVTGVSTAIICTMPISFLMITVNLFTDIIRKKKKKKQGAFD